MRRPTISVKAHLGNTGLRASTARPDRLEGYLRQIRWLVASGGRIDIEDFSGKTQRAIAEGVQDPERRRQILDALVP
jgi:hypothetical protein